jgi:hypothetical protein
VILDSILKQKISEIISGIGSGSTGNLIYTIAGFLRTYDEQNVNLQKTRHTKAKETSALIDFISKYNLWFTRLDENRYAGEGAEQKVYIEGDGRYVLKINDSIFYSSWLDYFHSLQIHNVLFPDTQYELLGFRKDNEKLYAVVKQLLVESTSQTNLQEVKQYLENNGFRKIRNNDYYSEDLGIILEDLHDENVLTNKGVLFFIDTVFYYLK